MFNNFFEGAYIFPLEKVLENFLEKRAKYLFEKVFERMFEHSLEEMYNRYGSSRKLSRKNIWPVFREEIYTSSRKVSRKLSRKDVWLFFRELFRGDI